MLIDKLKADLRTVINDPEYACLSLREKRYALRDLYREHSEAWLADREYWSQCQKPTVEHGRME